MFKKQEYFFNNNYYQSEFIPMRLRCTDGIKMSLATCSKCRASEQLTSPVLS